MNQSNWDFIFASRGTSEVKNNMKRLLHGRLEVQNLIEVVKISP